MFCKANILLTQSLLVWYIQHGLASELRLGKSQTEHRGLQTGTLKLVGNEFPPGVTLNACEGDCDKDSECKPGLKCKQRNGNETVPGCTGDKPEYAGVDFCYVPVPAAGPPLKFVGNNGAVGLLNVCEGDCDRDSECKSGLKCFQRTGLQAVPGCSGDKPEWSGFDFCYVPVKPPVGKLKYVGNNAGPGFPLNACEGDCDKDSECKIGLKCFQRGGTETVPGCTGDKSEWKGYDFCYKP
jgi:hypothetical protein